MSSIEIPNLYKMGIIYAYLAGRNHYTGAERLADGDKIELIREPENSADANAIVAKTPQETNEQFKVIGYINKNSAQCLAPLMDEKKITIHATRDESSGSQNSYTTKVKIHVFTTMEADGALDDLAEKLSRQFGEKFQEREE